MKIKTHLIFTVIVLFFVTISSHRAISQSDYSEDRVKEMLKRFYTSYISTTKFEKLDSIKNIYCTSKIFNYVNKLLRDQTIDYDPFLKSQMVDVAMLKTLAVRKDFRKNDLYYVSYTYGNETITVKLSVVKEKQEYKIDHVFLDGID